MPIQRCQDYLQDIQPGTSIAPSFSESIGWPNWARFVQMHVADGMVAQIRFAKDKGLIGASPSGINQASWETKKIAGPDSSAFLALPETGQIQLANYGTAGFVLLIFLSSLGGSDG